MEKSPDAFRTISEVADLLETPAHVLRFWESRFPQIRPVKRAGGRRYYRPADIALLAGIRHLLHDQGMTIRGVQKLLREQGVRHVSALGGTATGLTFEGTVLPDDAEAPEDAAPEGVPDAATDTDAPEAPLAVDEAADAGRIIPWPGPATPVAAAAPDPVAPSEPVADTTAQDVAALPDDADQALAQDVAADPPNDAAMPPLPPAEPSPAPAPPRTVQSDLFGDLPLFFRQAEPAGDDAPGPAAIVQAAAEPATPTEPAPPRAVDAASMADIRSMVVRIRHLPPGALAQAGLAPAVARLSALRDRMKAPPSGHAS